MLSSAELNQLEDHEKSLARVALYCDHPSCNLAHASITRVSKVIQVGRQQMAMVTDVGSANLGDTQDADVESQP